jgi:hypothetical protein
MVVGNAATPSSNKCTAMPGLSPCGVDVVKRPVTVLTEETETIEGNVLSAYFRVTVVPCNSVSKFEDSNVTNDPYCSFANCGPFPQSVL